MSAHDDRHLPRITGAEARELLGQPWPIIPARSYRDAPDAPVKKETAAKWKHLQGDAADDSYRNYAAALWAVVTGAGSGIVVLDADTDDALHGLEPHVGTGRGVGGHLYVRHPGWRVKTQAGVLPGLDVRGDGGVAYFAGASLKGPYQVLRPITPYEVSALPEHVARAAGLLEAPDKRKSAADRVNSPSPQSAPQWHRDGNGTAAALAWLRRRCEAVSDAPEGTWNQTFHRAVFGAAGLVAAWELDGQYAATELLRACDDPDEAADVFQSSWEAGLEAPWSAEPPLRTFDATEYLPVNLPEGRDDAAPVNSPGLSDDDEEGEYDPTMHPLAIRRATDTRRWHKVQAPPEVVEAFTLGQADMDAIRPPTWLVPGRLQAGVLAQVAGPSGVGKSVLVLNWLLDLTSPKKGVAQVLGFDEPGVKVLYLAAEGISGHRARIKAWEQETGRTWNPDRLRFRDDVPALVGNPEALASYISMLSQTGPWDIVVIDTLSRAIAGKNENDAEVMSEAVEAMDMIKRAVEGTVLAIHHFGWEGTRQRGSSVLYSACDNVLYLYDRGNGRIKLHTDKIKDGKPGWDEYYDLTEVGASVVLRLVPIEAAEAGESKAERIKARIRALRSANPKASKTEVLGKFNSDDRKVARPLYDEVVAEALDDPDAESA